MERGVLNLVNYGNDQRFSHIIISLTEASSLARQITKENCKIVELHKTTGNDFRLPQAIARTVQQYNINVLHARGWPTMVETVIANSFQKVKGLLYGFHGRTIDEIRTGRSYKRIGAERIFIRFYDRVITLTDSMRQELSRECWLPERKIEVVHNGVDVERYAPYPNKKMLRERFGVPLERFVIGAVGRLDPVKNHEAILRAVSVLKLKGQKCVFLLVGSGEHRHVLEREIQRLDLQNEVILYGRSSQISELINCMDVFVQSSWYEGFSNTLLEAMSCGVPVIASGVGGNASVVPDLEERNLFDLSDEGSLAEKIVALIHDSVLYKTVGSLGRERVLNRFSIQRMVEHYEREYSRLAE